MEIESNSCREGKRKKTDCEDMRGNKRSVRGPDPYSRSARDGPRNAGPAELRLF